MAAKVLTLKDVNDRLGSMFDMLNDVKLSLLNPRPQTQIVKHEYSPEPQPREYRVRVSGPAGDMIGQFHVYGPTGVVNVDIPQREYTTEVRVPRKWYHRYQHMKTVSGFTPPIRFQIEVSPS